MSECYCPCRPVTIPTPEVLGRKWTKKAIVKVPSKKQMKDKAWKERIFKTLFEITREAPVEAIPRVGGWVGIPFDDGYFLIFYMKERDGTYTPTYNGDVLAKHYARMRSPGRFQKFIARYMKYVARRAENRDANTEEVVELYRKLYEFLKGEGIIKEK